MIYGIIASESHQSLPLGPVALGTFDFVNGVYDWQGSSLTASQVTDQTGWIDASGLAVPGSGSYGAQIIYADTQTLLATCIFTAVIEMETLDYSTADILVVCNTGESYYINAAFWGTWNLYDYCPTADRTAEDDVHSVTPGIRKIAISRSNTAISISVDGNAVVTDTTANSILPVDGFPMTKFYLGGWPDYTDGAVRIRSASFYDLQADSELPGLSA